MVAGGADHAEQAGLPADGGNRRVKGLRREEVAMLAGIRAEYYVFPSIGAVYDALFKRAASENLAVLREAMARGEPGSTR